MRIRDVPQDESATFAGHKKAVYAVDPQGHYTTVESSGWQVEEIVTHLAVAEFERLLEQARQRCRRGLASPLEYHMFAHRMDLPTLADATGLARWRVRRHLRPTVFPRLGPALLDRYARAMQIPAEQLRSLPQDVTASHD